MGATNYSQTNNQLYTKYDFSKIALGDNIFDEGNVVASGADVEILQGDVIGRVSSTGALVKSVSTATDGSQYALGVAAIDLTVLDGETKTLTVITGGKVAQEKVTLTGVETLDTPVGPAGNQRTYADWLRVIGVILVESDDLTEFDN